MRGVRHRGLPPELVPLKRLCHYAGETRLVAPAENLTAFTRALKRLGYVLPGE